MQKEKNAENNFITLYHFNQAPCHHFARNSKVVSKKKTCHLLKINWGRGPFWSVTPKPLENGFVKLVVHVYEGLELCNKN